MDSTTLIPPAGPNSEAVTRTDAPEVDIGFRPPELSIVIPTFNERGNIMEVIRRISNVLSDISWEVIIVDDDSPDGTAMLAKEAAQTDPRIRCLRRVNRRGLAGACIEGMLSSAAPYLVVMDADLQHDETVLPRMLSILRQREAELVIGSRHVAGGSSRGGLSNVRAIISRLSINAARLVLGTEVRDLMSGFFAIRRDCFDEVAPRLMTSGFKILADIIASAPTELRIAEVGYRFRERLTGESKLDAKVALDFAALLINKLTRDVVPIRFICFSIVGAIGVVIHLSVLRLTMLMGVDFPGAQAFAALVAMTSNFLINNQITYRDQKLRGAEATLRGLFLFYGVCAFGAIANVGVGTWTFDRTHVWWLAGLLGLVIGAVWNYTLSSLFVWPRREY
jgi:dolichol-phosphate mannosyltransferase